MTVDFNVIENVKNVHEIKRILIKVGAKYMQVGKSVSLL